MGIVLSIWTYSSDHDYFAGREALLNRFLTQGNDPNCDKRCCNAAADNRKPDTGWHVSSFSLPRCIASLKLVYAVTGYDLSSARTGLLGPNVCTRTPGVEGRWWMAVVIAPIELISPTALGPRNDRVREDLQAALPSGGSGLPILHE
ncbi:hypothetical protein ACFVWF_30290 [Rhodococcus qingshengii]|uniref:hypothetical protein n=1 Tax=Rhodococcus qingshengii TaxID=334542 RepID=UPI0036DEF487